MLLLPSRIIYGQRAVVGNTTTRGLTSFSAGAPKGSSNFVSSFRRYSTGVDRLPGPVASTATNPLRGRSLTVFTATEAPRNDSRLRSSLTIPSNRIDMRYAPLLNSNVYSRQVLTGRPGVAALNSPFLLGPSRASGGSLRGQSQYSSSVRRSAAFDRPLSSGGLRTRIGVRGDDPIAGSVMARPQSFSAISKARKRSSIRAESLTP